MTFIIIDLIIKSISIESIQQFRVPPHTKRLFDLCKCSQQNIELIIFWAIGNTLVTNKLDIAMNVAYS
jgi:chromosome segregation ATPase